MRATIIGAGIGGLAAAIALRHIGVDALVLERAPCLCEVGAGISLWSNAVNALRELGLDASVNARASVVERTVVKTPSGRLIVENDFGVISRMAGAPCLCILRGTLQRILLDALPLASIVTGANCSGFDGTTAILGSGKLIKADVIIGADGISSVIREGLHGQQPPRYAGYTCWRAVCDDNGLLPDRSALLVIGAGSQFGLWPCGPGKLYWFLTRNTAQGTTATRARILSLYQNWAQPVCEVIEHTPDDAILQNSIVDRPPLKRWGRGAVTLLGDAAHASTPNLGQGACQAFEDALTLAHCLSATPSIETALRKYEGARTPRTSTIVKNSWRAGKVLQLDSPMLESLRNRFMSSWLGNHLQRRAFRELLTYQVPKLPSSV